MDCGRHFNLFLRLNRLGLLLDLVLDRFTVITRDLGFWLI
jgi:hypothetical protein